MPERMQEPSGKPPIRLKTVQSQDVVQTEEPQAQPPVQVSKPKKAKKVKKVPEQPHPDTPVPTMGPRALLYKLNLRFGGGHKVPPLSNKEIQAIENRQAEMDAEWQDNVLQYRLDRVDRIIIALSDIVGSQRVSMVQTKGSGATTTVLVYAASEHGHVTHSTVTAADFNLASGNMGRKLGRDFGKTLTLGELVREHAEKTEYREFIEKVRPTPYNVRVVSADNIIEAGVELTADEALRVMRVLYGFTEFLYMDTLNKITDPVGLANVSFSDVLVFTANVKVQESMRQLGSSMETLRRQGHRDLVNNAVVAISNIPPGHDVQEYRKYLNIVDVDNNVTSETGREFEGQVVGIPNDPVIELDHEVDRGALQYDTLMAIKKLVIAILQQNPAFRSNPSAAEINLKNDVEPVREVITGFKHYRDYVDSDASAS